MSLGSAIGAVVGGVLGFFIAGPKGAFIGASIGFSLGSIVDPIRPDVQQPGNPAEKLQVTLNTIGTPVKDVLGTAEMAGFLLAYGKERSEEVTEETRGGKGGGGAVTGYRYYATWALGICAGPVDSVYAIIREAEEIMWIGALNRSPMGEAIAVDGLGIVTFFFGTAEQVAHSALAGILPDSTLNTGWRHLCWVLFDDCLLGSYNRLPTMRFIVRKTPGVEIVYERQLNFYRDLDGDGWSESGEGPFFLEFDAIDGDIPVVGDWTGNGISKVGIYRPSTGEWFLDLDGDDVIADAGVVFKGPVAGDVPVVGNWTGTGMDKIGIFRSSTAEWFLDLNGNYVWDEGVDAAYNFGQVGDIPVAGDWTGSGIDRIGVFRDGFWYLDANGNGVWDDIYGGDIAYTEVSWLPTDVPIVGDWIGDGVSRIGVYRSGVWCLDTNPTETGFGDGIWVEGDDTKYESYGLASDVPLVGNWDGTGKDRIGVCRVEFRPSSLNYNAALAIRYVLCTLAGLPSEWLNDAGFTEVEEVLDLEDLGISLLFDNPESALGYLEMINMHIDAIIQYGTDGKFRPKLIRYDYDVDSLPLVDESIMLEDPTIERGAWIDTINEVPVQYSEIILTGGLPSMIKQSTADPPAMDPGNVAVQGMTVSKTIQLALFTNNSSAVWGSKKGLQKVSYPYARVSVPVNRKLFRVEVGDCFKLAYEKYGIIGMICRLVAKEEEGLESERIIITAIEDAAMAASPPVAPSVIEDIPPSPDLSTGSIDYRIFPFRNQIVFEAPYALSRDEISVIPVAMRKMDHDLGFQAHMSIDGGNSYSFVESYKNIRSYGKVVDSEYPSGTYTIDTERGFVIEFENDDFDQIETVSFDEALAGVKNLALLGDELISFQTITPISGRKCRIETIFRSRYGTVKDSHVIGEDFYFLGAKVDVLSHKELMKWRVRQFKLVPYNVRKFGNIADATAFPVLINGIAKTSGIPANFCANGGSFAPRYDTDIVLTWSAKYRGKGAGIGVAGKVLSESVIEGLFEINVFVGSVLVRPVTGLDVTTWTYEEAMNLSDNGSLADEVRILLRNYREEGGVVYSSDWASVTCKKN